MTILDRKINQEKDTRLEKIQTNANTNKDKRQTIGDLRQQAKDKNVIIQPAQAADASNKEREVFKRI